MGFSLAFVFRDRTERRIQPTGSRPPPRWQWMCWMEMTWVQCSCPAVWWTTPATADLSLTAPVSWSSPIPWVLTSSSHARTWHFCSWETSLFHDRSTMFLSKLRAFARAPLMSLPWRLKRKIIQHQTEMRKWWICDHTDHVVLSIQSHGNTELSSGGFIQSHLHIFGWSAFS